MSDDTAALVGTDGNGSGHGRVDEDPDLGSGGPVSIAQAQAPAPPQRHLKSFTHHGNVAAGPAITVPSDMAPGFLRLEQRSRRQSCCFFVQCGLLFVLTLVYCLMTSAVLQLAARYDSLQHAIEALAAVPGAHNATGVHTQS